MRTGALRHPTVRRNVGRSAAADRSGGFVLLDALVAVAVLAALLLALPSSFVTARKTLDRSQAWLEARLVAETVLERELGADPRIGAYSGSLNGRDWRAIVRPERGISLAPTPNGQTMLHIRVMVDVHRGRVLDIETLRAGGPS